VALKVFQAIRTSSLLVQQCRKVLNDISAMHALELYWVCGHAGVRGNEITDGLTRGGSASGFVGPELAYGVSRQNI
jgi:ribonuclease HI